MIEITQDTHPAEYEQARTSGKYSTEMKVYLYDSDTCCPLSVFCVDEAESSEAFSKWRPRKRQVFLIEIYDLVEDEMIMYFDV